VVGAEGTNDDGSKDWGGIAAPPDILRMSYVEVIQPQLPLRLRFYDFFLVAILMFDPPK
jgi:hypothetical protein